MHSNTPELLAPAGNLAAGITALVSGADAVYCGLKKFNARERAENFSFDDMSRLLTFAHTDGKKVYATFNTLVKESELAEVAGLIAKIAELGADAVIVQDVGIVRLVREYFPGLDIHASTQMAIHNSEGVAAAAAMGIRRVILERQLTLGEMCEISRNSPVETEIFVHGALCCSLSGQCLFSSWFGGFSGNRGKCKQPCRYMAETEGTAGYQYPLSTRDLSHLRNIPEIRKMKIASLKIEGRLRGTDYLKNVVSAYRMVLDAGPKDEAAALREAEKLLRISHGRETVPGFKSASGNTAFGELINPLKSGVTGTACGEVTETCRDGFHAKTTGRIHVGDKLRAQKIDGSEGTAFTVKKLSVDGENRMLAAKGENCLIFCRREDVKKGDFLYKIGESSDPSPAKFAKLPLKPKFRIDLVLSVSKDRITAEIPGTDLLWEKQLSLSQAEKHPLAAETVEDEFRAASSDVLETGEISATVGRQLFFPSSLLKETRREFWTWAAEKVEIPDRAAKFARQLGKFLGDYSEASSKAVCNEFAALVPAGAECPVDNAFVCQPITGYDDLADELVLPFFTSESEIPELFKLLGTAVKKGVRRFRLTSLSHFPILRKLLSGNKSSGAGGSILQLTASFPLQCCNSLAACEFRRLGADKAQVWCELEKEEMENLAAKSAIPLEIYRYGRIPLLLTRGNTGGDKEIRDFRGNLLHLRKDGLSGLTLLFPEEPLSLPPTENCGSFYDLTNARMDEKHTSIFNYERKLK